VPSRWSNGEGHVGIEVLEDIDVGLPGVGEDGMPGRQVLVSVACNGAHSLKERLARWLLMMRDRSDEDALPITHSLLAEMLGVQRPTITNAARELERAGLIERGRREVTILDRQGLIEESCECYQLVRARVASHLPKTYT
jgi:DNA-binding transcriptional ArsR family regulator